MCSGDIESWHATYLCVDEGVERSTTREDDEGEADRNRQHKAKLDRLAEDGRSEVHKDVPRDVLVTECNVAKVSDL